jgi:hypothetical protein
MMTMQTQTTSNRYAYEEVKSNYGYLSGYHPILVLAHDQVKVLKGLFPELGDCPIVGNLAGDVESSGAEGKFAIPNLWRPEPVLSGTYNDNVIRVLDLIKQGRDGAFCNYRDGELGPERLRQSAHAEAALRKISEEQGHPDILVVAAQFGIQHRGRSVRRAREVMADQGQFGLGAFAIGIMLRAHPKRLEHCNDLWIDCAGDEYDSPDADFRFADVPVFCFHDAFGGVAFGAHRVDSARDSYGSVSAFVPQF